MSACHICGEDESCDKSCKNDRNEFCLCGRRFTDGFEIQGSWVFLCEVCDADEDETHDPYEGEEPCSCLDGTINPTCRWCFG